MNGVERVGEMRWMWCGSEGYITVSKMRGVGSGGWYNTFRVKRIGEWK